MSDKTFDKNIISSSRPIITRNREYQFNQQQSSELNTYATWGETAATVDSMENYVIDKDGNQVIIGSSSPKMSVKSLFNKYSTVFKSDDGRYFIVVCEEKSEAPEWALQIKADLIEAEYTAYYTEMESGYSSNLIIDQEAIAKFCNNAAKKR